MEFLEAQLDCSIKWFGCNDLITIMLSQRLDKLIVEEQKKNMEAEKCI